MSSKERVQAQNIIADEKFKYFGTSVVMIDVVNAIKSGFRLFNHVKFEKEMARLKGFLEDWQADSSPEEVYRLVETIEEIVRKCE